MGLGMAANLAKSGQRVVAFDLSAEALARARARGCETATSAAEAVAGADVIVTMLQTAEQVRRVYADAVIPHAPKGALAIDCSTIDVATARAVAADAAAAGLRPADAPVSGGVGGAEAGTLTFMVGCDDALFATLQQRLSPMAKTVVHAGAAGAGQAAKDLQQHGPWHFHDRRLRGLRACREARAGAERFFDVLPNVFAVDPHLDSPFVGSSFPALAQPNSLPRLGANPSSRDARLRCKSARAR